MQVDAALWKRLITLIRDATPNSARPLLSAGGDVRPIPVAKWLPPVEAEVRPEFNRLILEANRISENAPSNGAVEYCREAWTAAISELTGDNEPQYKLFRRPGAEERESRFRLQDDLERAKTSASLLEADLELERTKRHAIQGELDSIKRRGWFARLLNR